MKKKPSLLDIELFAQERATEKEQELTKNQEESHKAVFESLDMEISSDDVFHGDPELYGQVDEKLNSVIERTDGHRDEINRLKKDMFKLKEQLRVYHSFLSSQQKKINELEKIKIEAPDNQGAIDTNYSKLLLKNIVWLKEEKEFSANDVARLFRAEGFQTIHPHGAWDAKVIDLLYQDAKKSFL